MAGVRRIAARLRHPAGGARRGFPGEPSWAARCRGVPRRMAGGTGQARGVAGVPRQLAGGHRRHRPALHATRSTRGAGPHRCGLDARRAGGLAQQRALAAECLRRAARRPGHARQLARGAALGTHRPRGGRSPVRGDPFDCQRVGRRRRGLGQSLRRLSGCAGCQRHPMAENIAQPIGRVRGAGQAGEILAGSRGSPVARHRRCARLRRPPARRRALPDRVVDGRILPARFRQAAGGRAGFRVRRKTARVAGARGPVAQRLAGSTGSDRAHGRCPAQRFALAIFRGAHQ